MASNGRKSVSPNANDHALQDFMRPRFNTWDSTDSGCSEASTVSGQSSKSDASTGSRSTIKRRCSSPEGVSKARRYVQQLQLARGGSDEDTVELDPPKVALPALTEVSSLTKAHPARAGGLELVIVCQPEGHHRARYQKEGSRGCIKDRTGNTCPAVQLKGYTGSARAVLQVFIATESGKVRPHHLYRACRVGGKHCTPSRDQTVENTTVLEMDILPENNWMVNMDCLGILKLRNADLDQSAESDTRKKKKTPQIRIAFRAVVPGDRGTVRTLQAVSTPVCCTPSPGMPEIHRTSHTSCPVTGGIEMIIIGRNFVKEETKIFITETNETDDVIWEGEIQVAKEYFHTVHLVTTLPAYKDLDITKPVSVNIIVKNKNKTSEPYPFTFTPVHDTKDGFRSRLASTGSSIQSVQSASLFQDDSGLSTIPTSPISEDFSYQASSSSLDNFCLESPASNVTNQALSYTCGFNSASSSYQYHIQPPGVDYPIIITIPQMGPEGAVRMPSIDLGAPGSVEQGGFSGVVFPTAQILGVPVNAGMEPTTDDEMFNTILRDLLADPEMTRNNLKLYP